MWGRIVFTDYGSGCLRSILAKSRGVRTGEIDECHKIRGAFNEEEYKKKLERDKIPYLDETKVVEQIGDTGVIFSGRVDIRVDPDNTGEFPVPEELKSTESKSKKSAVISGGKYGLNQMAQLVAYMVALRSTIGRLIFTYYDRAKDGTYSRPPDKMYAGRLLKSERIFEVEVDERGTLVIDNKPSQWTVDDQLLWRQTAAEVINSGEVWERPFNYDSNYGSPCKFCEFSQTCQKWDDGILNTTEEFVRSAQTEANEKGAK